MHLSHQKIIRKLLPAALTFSMVVLPAFSHSAAAMADEFPAGIPSDSEQEQGPQVPPPFYPPFYPQVPPAASDVPALPAPSTIHFVGAVSDINTYYRNGRIDLKFSDLFEINHGEQELQEFLRKQIFVANDGENFKPLPDALFSVQNDKSIEIKYELNSDMKVISGPNAKIKIAADTMKDSKGDSNAEMILEVAPPVLQDVVLSNDYHDVTISFNKQVFENEEYTGEYSIKDYIEIARDAADPEDGWEELGTLDSAEIQDGKLVIHFEHALWGKNNQIKIWGYSLKDQYGNCSEESYFTSLIAGGNQSLDLNPPKMIESYLSKDKQKVTIVFDETVESSQDIETLKSGLRLFNNNTVTSLPSDATVTLTENKLILEFTSSIFSSNVNYAYFAIPANAIQDSSGNAIAKEIYTKTLYNYYGDSSISFREGGFSQNGRLMTLQFEFPSFYSSDEALTDATLVDGVSHLKEKITISTDKGASYLPLEEQDLVMIYNKKLVVFFHNAIQAGTIRVKIEAGALSNEFGTLILDKFEETIAHNTPDVAGFFLSDAPSEITLEHNEAWQNHIRNILVFDLSRETIRTLKNTEYVLAKGKLVIQPGVFQTGGMYTLRIEAEGYSTREVYGVGYKSSDLFYMTAPSITTTEGVKASVEVLNMNSYYSMLFQLMGYPVPKQSVVFELMNGSTPVSIVAGTFNVSTGTYSAVFNVADAANNPNYSVKAFIVSDWNNDAASAGVNLATQVTQEVYDLKKLELELTKPEFPNN